MPSRAVLLLLVLLQVAVGWAFVHDAGPGFPLDDAWVHVVYAGALARGEGFAYNPGQPETGMSAPLWTALCALPVGLAERLDQRPDPWVRAFGLCVAALALARAGRLASRAGRWPAVFVVVLMALDPLGLFGALSGTEQPLFAWLSLRLLGLVLDRRVAAAGWTSVAIVLTRPEALVLVALAGQALYERRPGYARWFAPRFLLPLAGVLALWAGYCVWASGRPWPDTFVQKLGLQTDVAAWGEALRALLSLSGFGWALPLLLLVGAVTLEGGAPRLGYLPLLMAPLLLLGILLTRPLPVVGELIPYYFARYALLAWPLVLLLVGAGLASIVRTAWAGFYCRPAAAALLVAPLALVLLLAHDVPARGLDTVRRYRAECAQIERQNVAAGQWINDNLPSSTLVATHDAGAIRWFGRREVLDIYGNNSGALTTALLAGGDAAAELLVSAGPGALVIFPRVPEYADFPAHLGLTRVGAVFHVDEPATVPGPVHEDLVVFLPP